jgi:plastocyanin
MASVDRRCAGAGRDVRLGARGDDSDHDGESRDLATRATAKVGDTVEWINKDIFAHTSTAQNGDWDVTMPPKKTVTSVLTKAGTIEYYCRFHPNMKATLTVTP